MRHKGHRTQGSSGSAVVPSPVVLAPSSVNILWMRVAPVKATPPNAATVVLHTHSVRCRCDGRVSKRTIRKSSQFAANAPASTESSKDRSRLPRRSSRMCGRKCKRCIPWRSASETFLPTPPLTTSWSESRSWSVDTASPKSRRASSAPVLQARSRTGPQVPHSVLRAEVRRCWSRRLTKASAAHCKAKVESECWFRKGCTSTPIQTKASSTPVSDQRSVKSCCSRSNVLASTSPLDDSSCKTSGQLRLHKTSSTARACAVDAIEAWARRLKQARSRRNAIARRYQSPSNFCQYKVT